METQQDPQKQNPQHVQQYNYEKKDKSAKFIWKQISCEASSLITVVHCQFFFLHTSVKSNRSTFIVTRLLECIMFQSLNNCLVFWKSSFSFAGFAYYTDQFLSLKKVDVFK